MSILDPLNSGGGPETYSTFIRNISLTIAAIAATFIGLPIAFYRSYLNTRQLLLAERGQRNEIFQRSAEMLGSQNLITRLAGIYALERLAREHSEEYHLQIMELLCRFARRQGNVSVEFGVSDQLSNGIDVIDNAKREKVNRTNSPIKSDHESSAVFPDVEAAVKVIGSREAHQIDIERRTNNFTMNLQEVNLKSASLVDCNFASFQLWKTNFASAVLSNVTFTNASLQWTNFDYADLSRSKLISSNATGASFQGAYLSDADLTCAFLESTSFEYTRVYGAKFTNAFIGNANFKYTFGLTQRMLDDTATNTGQPPFLHDSICEESKMPLVWNSKNNQ